MDDLLSENVEPDFDTIYQRYCVYAERSRVALLRIILSPSGRRLLTDEPPSMEKEAFRQVLASMSLQTRQDFIATMMAGYDAEPIGVMRKYME